jgi:hypothetical protein
MTLSDKKRLVVRFLERCNAYADAEIAKYRQRLEHATGADALRISDEIAHWAAYRAFNEHAIGELGTKRLDDWLA